MRDTQAALSRVPFCEDVCQGESAIFAAQRVCYKKTDNKWSLYDLFGDTLKGSAGPGADSPAI